MIYDGFYEYLSIPLYVINVSARQRENGAVDSTYEFRRESGARLLKSIKCNRHDITCISNKLSVAICKKCLRCRATALAVSPQDAGEEAWC